MGKVDFIFGIERPDFLQPPRDGQAGHFASGISMLIALASPPISPPAPLMQLVCSLEPLIPAQQLTVQGLPLCFPCAERQYGTHG
jgi:hypothetical protein